MTGIVFGLLFFLSSFAIADTHNCGNDNSSAGSYGWCIDKTDATTGPDVLYFFHPVFGSEQSWNQQRDQKEIRKEWAAMGVKTPTVISISFGWFWLMSEEVDIHQAIINEIMPEMEKKIGGVRGRRLLMGRSLGGYNASMLVLKNPELWAKTVLACPAFLNIGPYSTKAEKDAFFARHARYISQIKVNEYLNLLGSAYKTEAIWQNHDPMTLVKTKFKHRSKIHISCGDVDSYGFFEGASLFAKTASKSGADVTWQKLSGGHCAMDAEEVAKFLAY